MAQTAAHAVGHLFPHCACIGGKLTARNLASVGVRLRCIRDISVAMLYICNGHQFAHAQCQQSGISNVLPELTIGAVGSQLFSLQLKEIIMDSEISSPTKVPWNKGKIVGKKAPLKLKDIWAIRIRLQLGHRTRELALFDLGLDSKLRACDLVRLRVRNICHGDRVSTRAF